MVQKSIIACIVALLSLTVNAQVKDTLNSTDKNGLKQGYWIKKDRYGNIQYEGYFKDDKPAGTFKRYYEDGKLQSVLNYNTDGKTADAVFYHPNGPEASKGKYINRKKEGKWQFFSAKDEGYLICEEEYLNNNKNGLSVKYYPDKTPAEKLTYSNDVKTGEWFQYYPGGKICLSANYIDGQLQGKFVVFFENGKPQFSGQYKDDVRDGAWLKYNPDGTLVTTINYLKGRPTDPDFYRKETEYLDSLDRNRGKIPDPEKTGTIWK